MKKYTKKNSFLKADVVYLKNKTCVYIKMTMKLAYSISVFKTNKYLT